MPTYDYTCDNCGHEFERQQRITENPVKKCPSCGKLKARRMIGGGNFILKGGGWESDLYSGPSNRTNKTNKTSESSTSSASSSSAASPSTPSPAPSSSTKKSDSKTKSD